MHNMANKEDKEFNVEFQIRGVEILSSSIKMPSTPLKEPINYNFNINIENSIDAANKRMFVIVKVVVNNEEQTITLGDITVSCLFEIVNFSEIVKTNKDGEVKIPQRLIETFNMISTSTVRGVMFSEFKGTFLHNALLPVIDAKQFQKGMEK